MKTVEQTELGKKIEDYIDCKKQIINEFEFEACIKRPGTFIVKNSGDEIIYNQEENPLDFKFYDFNEDGYADILLNYATNSPGHQDLLLYDEKKNKFDFVESFYNFPNSKKIKESNLYYSYHGNGCADFDWISELYGLNGTIITELGKIKGFGCLDNVENGIYVYKVNGNDEKLLNYTKREQGYWKGKFEFIEEYWSENKNIFE
jgi:hypothetical protein